MVELNTIYYEDFDVDDPAIAIRFTKLAKDIEKQSQHHKYKVGAVAYGLDKQGRSFYLATVNHIPEQIAGHFSSMDYIGDGHPSIHAEMAAMQLLPDFQKVSFTLSRPPCPTCFQAMSELRNYKLEHGTVQSVYTLRQSLAGDDPMNQKSLDKWKLAKPMIKNTSHLGGVGFGWVNLEKQSTTTKYKPAKDTDLLYVASPITTIDPAPNSLDSLNLQRFIQQALELTKVSDIPGNTAAALIMAPNAQGDWLLISACANLPPGFNYEIHSPLIQESDTNDKPAYNYIVSPTKRVMVGAIKEGINLEKGVLITTEVPISGMLINAVGYGLTNIITPPIELDMTNPDHEGLYQLTQAGILNHTEIDGLQTKNELNLNLD